MTITAVLRRAFIFFSASIWVLPASGACNPPKSLSTFNAVTGTYAYWHTTLEFGSLNANIWSGGVDHTGTCNTSSAILYFGVIPGDIGMNMSLGDACVSGCPSGSLSILASATNGIRTETLVAQAQETPGGAVDFDFSQSGPHPLGVYPAPQVTSSSRNGNVITLNLFIPAITVYDDAGSGITGFNVLRAESQTDPGRFASAYTFGSFIPSPGGGGATGSVNGNCPIFGSNDVWFVTQIVTSAGGSNIVSAARRIHCQIFAEPMRKLDKRMGTQVDD